MPRTRLLIPLTLIAAFALPAAADASFQSRITDPTHVSITGTDEAEAIVISSDAVGHLTHDQTSPGFASAHDFDTTAPGTQFVSGSPIVTVDGEGGDDRIRNATASARLSADGGDGDDQLYGSAHHDVLQGGTGDDYAAGGGASDAIYLGAGDDRYQWTASADGNDLVVGGDGVDSASAWGTQLADEFTVSPATSGVFVALTGAYRLHVDSVEDVSVPLFAGDDTVATELIGAAAAVRLDADGGAGDDVLSGGDGDDDLSGGTGRDSVSGYGGDDTLAGESVVGDIGNDRMTIRAQDAASGYAEGDEGYDTTTLVTGDGADSLSLSPSQSSYVRAQGTIGGAPFSGALFSEAVALQTGAGDDAVTVQPGTGTVAGVTVNAWTGDDVLRGSDGFEHLYGSAGQDVIDGGLGPDRLDGSAGADVIRARDRAADTIACDADDTVLTDLAALDQLAGACAPVEGVPATGAVALARVVPGDGLRLGQGVAKVPVACSAGARGGCQGTLTLVSASPFANGMLTPLRLGSRPVALAPGTTAEVQVPIADGEDLARLMGTRRIDVQAQVLTAAAEHTTKLSLDILR